MDSCRKREGWMCAVSFDHELGNASRGDTVYPSIEDLKKYRICVNTAGQENSFCYPKRVYLFDADEFDKSQIETTLLKKKLDKKS